MLFKKDELKHLWPFYLYYLVFGLSAAIMPFMMVYFRNLNMSFFQIAAIISGYGIAILLFEVPTGAFADGYSRKKSVILGMIISAVAIMIIPTTTKFYILFIAWMLAGIGMTFISGAEEAWVIDNLNKLKKKKLQQEFFIKSQSVAAFGAIFAPFLGALIVKNNSIKILWILFGAGFLINAVILFLFGKELYKPKKTTIKKAIKYTYTNSREGLRFTFKNKSVFLIILAGLFIHLMSIGDFSWEPYLVELGLAQHQLGYVFSIVAAVLMVTPFLSRLFSEMKPKNAISIITGIRIIVLLSLLFVYPPLFLIAAFIMILDGGLFGIKDPIIQTYFHKFIPKNIRATVVSTQSMAVGFVVTVASLAAGILLDIFGAQKVIAYGSLFGIIAIILYQKIKD